MEFVRVGDIVSLKRRPVSVEASEYYEEIGVRSFGRGLFHKDAIQGADLGNKRVFEIHPGDLVISNVFAWEGAVAVADAAEQGKIGSHRFMTFEVDAARTTASYLRYFFLSDAGLALIRAASPGSAGRNRTLGIKAFESIEIPLPVIDQQRAIAYRLESIQEKSVTALGELETATGLHGKLVSSLVHRPDLSDAAKAQRGWRHIRLDEYVSHVDRREPIDDEAEYRVTGIYSFGKGLIDRGHIRGADTSYKRLAPLCLHDLVMSRLNGWEGALAIVDERFVGSYVSNEYPTFEIDQHEVDLGFFSAVVATPAFWRQLDDETRGSMVRRRRVHPRALLAIEMWFPPMEYQIAVSEQVAALRRMAQDESRREMLEAMVPSAINATFADFG